MAKVNLLDASNHYFDNTLSGLTSVTTQSAIDEIKLTVEQGAVTSLLNLGIVDGTNGQYLKTDGSGNFSFDTVPNPTLTSLGISNHNLVTVNGTGDISTTGTVTGSNLNVSNWDTAHSWGDHSLAGYAAAATTLSGYGITDAFDGAFSSLTGKPTTVSGYGITDAFDGAFSSLTGKPTTVSGYGITDAFDGAFSSLTGKPTTVAGYGITDAVQEGDSVTLTGDVTGTATFDSNGNVSVACTVSKLNIYDVNDTLLASI
jgi:hypothetical protein